MNIIKLISNERKWLLEETSGQYVLLPNDSNSINSFVFPNVIVEDTYYILEVSPDDNNPLNYNGVKIALNIYFKHLQENKLKCFIHLIGFESKGAFLYDCDYSAFLKCPNVTYQQINIDFTLITPSEIASINPNRAIDLLKNINLSPPASYKTNHSISNEWAISRWSAYLGFKTSLDSEIEVSLYFQYLKTIYQIQEVQENKNYLMPTGGNLLLIDDEEDKGWLHFFNQLKLPSSSLKIKSLGKKFKNVKTRQEIIKMCGDKIDEFKPHTIILDLRLHKEDFGEDNPKKLTGYQILEKIKKDINPGIQVILFTASNKVWNYRELNTIGFDGWITKESPELSVDRKFTEKAIKDLKKQLDFCLKRAEFLIDASNRIEQIKDLLRHNDLFDSDKDELRNKFFSNLDITFDLLKKGTESEDHKKYLNYAYLQLFLIIEDWLKQDFVFLELKGSYFVVNLDNNCLVRKPTEEEDVYEYEISWEEENKKGFYVIKNCKKKNKRSKEDTMFKMSAVLLFKFRVESMKGHEWAQISWTRNNKAAHPGDHFITEPEIHKLLKFLMFLFNQNNC